MMRPATSITGAGGSVQVLPRTHDIRCRIPEVSALGVIGLARRVEEDEKGCVDDPLECRILHLSELRLSVDQNQRGRGGCKDDFGRLHVEAARPAFSPFQPQRSVQADGQGPSGPASNCADSCFRASVSCFSCSDVDWGNLDAVHLDVCKFDHSGVSVCDGTARKPDHPENRLLFVLVPDRYSGPALDLIAFVGFELGLINRNLSVLNRKFLGPVVPV